MLFYITECNLNETVYSGVHKKIMAQIRALEKEFGIVYYTIWDWKFVYLMYGENIVKRKVAVTRRNFIDVVIDWMKEYDVKCTYIRYIFANTQFIRLLQYQKENCIKTLIEIPTYPYDEEILYGRFKVEDNYFRSKIENYVNAIATYSQDKEIWGIPCIHLNNGIDIEKIPIAKYKEKDKAITMIAVSSMSLWHGYERVIGGIYDYYRNGGDWKLCLKLVGEGRELDKYRKLTEKYGLQPHAKFYGKLEGESLNQIFDESDLGLVSFGLHKIGIDKASPIKGAEYCARGIPMICGYHDMRFPKNTPFVLEVPNNDNPIDMGQVIKFYKCITKQEDFRYQIRDYAIQHLSWIQIMKCVTEYLQL